MICFTNPPRGSLGARHAPFRWLACRGRSVAVPLPELGRGVSASRSFLGQSFSSRFMTRRLRVGCCRVRPRSYRASPVAHAVRLGSAARRTSSEIGVDYWTLWGLRFKQPKRIFADAYCAIRGAYEAEVARQERRYEHERQIAKALGTSEALVSAADAVAGQKEG